MLVFAAGVALATVTLVGVWPAWRATRVDPTIAFTFGTFDQLVEATVTQERLIAMLAAFFGGLALLLAAVGLYGVVSHAVRARQAELGLRIALGATSSSIVRLVFQRGDDSLNTLAIASKGHTLPMSVVDAIVDRSDDNHCYPPRTLRSGGPIPHWPSFHPYVEV